MNALYIFCSVIYLNHLYIIDLDSNEENDDASDKDSGTIIIDGRISKFMPFSERGIRIFGFLKLVCYSNTFNILNIISVDSSDESEVPSPGYGQDYTLNENYCQQCWEQGEICYAIQCRHSVCFPCLFDLRSKSRPLLPICKYCSRRFSGIAFE